MKRMCALAGVRLGIIVRDDFDVILILCYCCQYILSQHQSELFISVSIELTLRPEHGAWRGHMHRSGFGR